MRILGIPEGYRGRGEQSPFKGMISENFPNLWKELDIQIQEANRMPTYLNTE